jgi:hypothetical protein
METTPPYASDVAFARRQVGRSRLPKLQTSLRNVVKGASFIGSPPEAYVGDYGLLEASGINCL